MAIVLLDLEETVIDEAGKDNFLPANIERIREFLSPSDTLGIMSWAIWDEKDKQWFKRVIQEPLEQELGHTFDEKFVFSMHDFSDIILKKRHKWVSREDMFDLFGKEECLLQLLRLDWFPEGDIVLIDDRVDNGLELELRNRKIRFINVLEDVW